MEWRERSLATLERRLEDFAKNNRFSGKGHLCVALVVTWHAKKRGLPLKPNDLLTKAKGQVANLGKSTVQAILKDHGIDHVLAEEGGRTSRGSVGKMREYAAFLNELAEEGICDLDRIELWWIDRVNEHFAGKPFVLRFDSSKSLRAVIRDLLSQAKRRQKQTPGATFLGTVLQHLVGAKLDLLLDDPVKHHGASVADEVSGRDADFLVEDVAIHVTTTPNEALIRKCRRNLDQALKPVIITTGKGAAVVEEFADRASIAERVDIFEAEQFLAGNFYEIGKFKQKGRRLTAEKIVEQYNNIVDVCETDPSLRINVGK